MILSLRRTLNYWFVGLVLTTVLWATGCNGPRGGTEVNHRPPMDDGLPSDVIRIGDPITIQFSGPQTPPAPIAERLKADGMIQLQFLKDPIKADGKTRSQLEEDIHRLYVPSIYTRLTVKVGVEGRVFTVAGQVRQPRQIQYSGDMTVLRAIAAAGDFTDFADRKDVRIIRSNGQRIRVDCIEAARDPSSKDIPIYPGDYIEVPRRLF